MLASIPSYEQEKFNRAMKSDTGVHYYDYRDRTYGRRYFTILDYYFLRSTRVCPNVVRDLIKAGVNLDSIKRPKSKYYNLLTLIYAVENRTTTK